MISGWPSCAHTCQLTTFLIMTDTHICTYVHHENRSLAQSLALMCSAISACIAVQLVRVCYAPRKSSLASLPGSPSTFRTITFDPPQSKGEHGMRLIMSGSFVDVNYHTHDLFSMKYWGSPLYDISTYLSPTIFNPSVI